MLGQSVRSLISQVPLNVRTGSRVKHEQRAGRGFFVAIRDPGTVRVTANMAVQVGLGKNAQPQHHARGNREPSRYFRVQQAPHRKCDDKSQGYVLLNHRVMPNVIRIDRAVMLAVEEVFGLAAEKAASPIRHVR